MDLGSFTYSLTPFQRASVAAAPMLVSLTFRLLIGKKRGIQTILMVSATWLAMNTMLTPSLHPMTDPAAFHRDLSDN